MAVVKDHSNPWLLESPIPDDLLHEGPLAIGGAEVLSSWFGSSHQQHMNGRWLTSLPFPRSCRVPARAEEPDAGTPRLGDAESDGGDGHACGLIGAPETKRGVSLEDSVDIRPRHVIKT